MKNSNSICSNSRLRNVKLRGVTSLRNAFPICAMPNGTRTRVLLMTLSKLAKMPCAVSGRKYAALAGSSIAPTLVLNIKLNWRGSVRVPGSLASGPTQRARSSALSVVKARTKWRAASSTSRRSYFSRIFSALARCSVSLSINAYKRAPSSAAPSTIKWSAR